MLSEARKKLSQLVKEVGQNRWLIVGVSQRSQGKACIVNSDWLEELVTEYELLKRWVPKKILKLGGTARSARGVNIEKEIAKARGKVKLQLEKRSQAF
jgi:hypothetical protein